jgi:hypothetical protein
MFRNPFLRFLVVSGALALLGYLVLWAREQPALGGEGLVEYLWYLPLALWAVGFGYLFVQIILAVGWFYRTAETGLSKAAAGWPKPVRDLIAITDYRPKQ